MTGEEYAESVLMSDKPVRFERPLSALERQAERARKLIAETEGPFKELLEKPLAKKAAKFGGAGARKLLRSIAPASELLGELGPLGVLAEPLFFPDPARRQLEAEGEARLQKAIAESARAARQRVRLPPVPPGSIPAGKRSRDPAARPPGPAPLPPLPAPHRPNLTKSELEDVLGEKRPRITRQETRSRGGPLPKPGRYVTPLPHWLEDVLVNVGGAAVDAGLKNLRDRGYLPRVSKRETRAPRSSPFPRLGFDTSADTSPPRPRSSSSAAPQPLTRTNTEQLPLPHGTTPGERDRCRCEKRPPRPSDKVPTVRSFKRRMSQYSLDNLRRG